MTTPDGSGDLGVILVQADLHWHDPEANFDHLDALLGRVAASADLVVLPEMFPAGFTMTPGAVGRDVGERACAYLSARARASGATFCGSTPHYLPAVDAYVNRMLLVRPDGEVRHYDKRHRFTMAGEHLAYAPGSPRPVIVEVAGWRLLLQVCYDLRFPVYSRNRPGSEAYDAAVYVANWPSPRRAHWTALLRARAIENQAYALGVNRVGTDGAGLRYAGDSAVFDPLGDAVSVLGHEPAAAAAALSRSRLAEVREGLPFLRDADPFELLPGSG